MTAFPHWANLLYNEPLAITPFRNETLCQAARDRLLGTQPTRIDATVLDLKPRAMAHEASQYTDDGRKPFAIKDGIAVVRTIGTTVSRGGFMDAESGMVGYDHILSQIRTPMKDEDVRGIFWIIDSPGGHTARLFQAANEIAGMAKAEGGKPIYAYVDVTAASAGYVLASAADVILGPEECMGGCLGVMLNIVDSSRMHEKLGLEPYVIRSSWSDRKSSPQPGEPMDEASLADLQKLVDEKGEMLVEFVSAMRKMTPKAVKATRGLVMHGNEMFRAGLLDEVCSESEAWALLRQETGA